jgi:hypothetical protein
MTKKPKIKTSFSQFEQPTNEEEPCFTESKSETEVNPCFFYNYQIRVK